MLPEAVRSANCKLARALRGPRHSCLRLSAEGLASTETRHIHHRLHSGSDALAGWSTSWSARRRCRRCARPTRPSSSCPAESWSPAATAPGASQMPALVPQRPRRASLRSLAAMGRGLPGTLAPATSTHHQRMRATHTCATPSRLSHHTALLTFTTASMLQSVPVHARNRGKGSTRE